jgi:hypothetical protein
VSVLVRRRDGHFDLVEGITPARCRARPLPATAPREASARKPELVVITGLSGSGKGSVLKALEDLGFYSVDNLPVELIPKFAELTRDNPSIQAAALVVDIREGAGLKMFPKVFAGIRKSVTARLIFLEADDDAIVRRFSETRRPHPLGTGQIHHPQHRERARAVGAHPRHGGPDHQHLQVHRPRVARVHRRAVPRAARSIQDHDLRHQLRLSQRRAAG